MLRRVDIAKGKRRWEIFPLDRFHSILKLLQSLKYVIIYLQVEIGNSMLIEIPTKMIDRLYVVADVTFGDDVTNSRSQQN